MFWFWAYDQINPNWAESNSSLLLFFSLLSVSLCCNSTVHTLFLAFPMVPQCEIAVWGMAGTPDPSVPQGLMGNGWVRAFFDVLLKDHHGCPGFRLTINQGPLWPAGLSRVWFMSAGAGRASDPITPPHLYHPPTHTHTTSPPLERPVGPQNNVSVRHKHICSYQSGLMLAWYIKYQDSMFTVFLSFQLWYCFSVWFVCLRYCQCL